MSRVNSDIRLRITGTDNSGPAVSSAMRNMDKLEQKAARSSMFGRGGKVAGVGFGGRSPQLPFGLQLGGGALGASLALVGMQRSLEKAEEAFKHFRLPPDTLPQIQRMNSYLKDTFMMAGAMPGLIAGAGAKALGLGPGYVPEGKVPRADIQTPIGQRSQDLPAVRLAAAELERAKQIEAQIQADEKSTEEMRNRAGQQTGQKSNALHRALMFQGSGEQFMRVGSRLRDVGLNMFGGLQTNLRGLGMFGAGVGRFAEGIGMEMGGRFGRRDERERLRDIALEPRNKRIKDLQEEVWRLGDMAANKEITYAERRDIVRGLLRDSGLGGVMPGGVSSQVGGMVTAGSHGNPFIKGQNETNKKLDEQNKNWDEALSWLKKIANQPDSAVVGI